ncbi:MAG: ABC transporter ATP-binding protein [Rickettsiaceae bacterium H1]|nr:ABC transporter ATP-binding protein [Rickettsiaceae bacterium H1]
MSLLTVRNLCHKYGNFHLKNINIGVNKKEIVYIIGESGCGKSTILKLIVGLEKPKSGFITIDNQTLCSDKLFVPPEKRGIGIIFQHPSLFPHKTVIENVMFAIRDMGKKEQYDAAMKKLEEVGMKSYADNAPHTISGGQQQLVTIARALVQKPKIVLLDEPFSSLDVTLKRKIREQMLLILSKYNIPIIIVTHDPEEALETADKIYIMKNGTIMQEGSPYEIYYNPVNVHFAKFFGVVNKIQAEYKGGEFTSIWGKIKTDRSPPSLPYVRPEAILLANQREGIKAKVLNVRFFNRIVDIAIENETYHMRFTIALLPKKDDIIYVTLDQKQVLFLID